MKIKSFLSLAATAALSVSLFSQSAIADKLDKVLQAGKVRCAIVLDFPPIGFRDKDNKPAGLDVEMCKDLAKALDVKPEIVGVTWAERIPALVSGKADVAVASASDTLERAKTAGFTIPYMVYQFVAVVNKNAKINKWEDLKNAKVGAAVGTTYESEFLKYKKENWPDSKGTYTSYKSESESVIAVGQGQVDAIIVTNVSAKAAINSGKHPNIKMGPLAPVGQDITGMMTLRKEYGWQKYLNLFINRQVRSGRFNELHNKYLGTDAPDLTVKGVYY